MDSDYFEKVKAGLDLDAKSHLDRAWEQIRQTTYLPPEFDQIVKLFWDTHLEQTTRSVFECLETGLAVNFADSSEKANSLFIVSVFPHSFLQIRKDYQNALTNQGYGYLDYLADIANQRTNPKLDIIIHWVISAVAGGAVNHGVTIATVAPRTPNLVLELYCPNLLNEYEY